MGIISLSNPLYNTVIAFVSVMALLYIIKPDTIYDRGKEEFRQFGMDDNKTILPIHVIAILLAIILYVLFNQLSKIITDVDNKNKDYSNIGNGMHIGNGRHIKYDGHIGRDGHIGYKHVSNSSRHDSEISSLKTQIAMMNNTINQMSQMNQMGMNQMSNVIDRLDRNNVIHQYRHPESSRSNRHRICSSYNSDRSDRSDKRGIYSAIDNRYSVDKYSANGSSTNGLSAKSMDVDQIVNSVLYNQNTNSIIILM